MLLIIDKSRKNAMTISDIFHYMGIISGISSPENAINEISNRYKAILFVSPENICSPEELVKSLRMYSLGAPVFAITAQNPNDNPKLFSLFDKTFIKDIFSSTLVYDILAYQQNHGKSLLGCYRVAGIDASIFEKNTTYFDIPIKFTKTETMILRYLISCYPNPVKAQNILKFSFKFSKYPEISNIRTHISIINKKFKAVTGRNLIVSEAKEGYKILAVAAPETV